MGIFLASLYTLFDYHILENTHVQRLHGVHLKTFFADIFYKLGSKVEGKKYSLQK